MVSFSTIHPHICPSETYLSLLILLSWWIVRLVGLGWHLIYILICILHASVYWTSLDQILRNISYNALYYYTSWNARRCPWIFLNSNCFSLKHHPATPECPQKNSAHSVQLFGRLLVTYIRMSCLIIKICTCMGTQLVFVN